MVRTPPGGPATIGGVIYQMLWCLLRLARYEVRDVAENEAGEIIGATMVLEPAGGGGDLREQVGDQYVVTQVKSRSGGGAWSLQDIIRQVFPDLLQAVCLGAPKPVYRFVTEGHIGDWRQVARFFRSLRDRAPGTNPTSQLSTDSDLGVGARLHACSASSSQLWTKLRYNERELFTKIVDTLSTGDGEGGRADLEQRVWHLLAHFEFLGEQSQETLIEEIDANLVGIVDSIEHVEDARARLLMRLAECARSGNTTIRLGAFLNEAGFRAIPTSHVSRLIDEAQQVLACHVTDRGYLATHHVQEDFAETIVDALTEKSIVVLTGRSGSGKSWHSYAVSRLLADRGALVAHHEASGTARETLDHAMGVLWNTVKRHDQQIPYDRAACRLPGPPPTRVLVIDRVDDVALAQDLALSMCRNLNIRLVLACGAEAAAAVCEVAGSTSQTLEVPEFTPAELSDYLRARRLPRSETIPADVRKMLVHPLLANLYCDLAGGSTWQPTNEYELFDRYWRKRLGRSGEAAGALDMGLLRELTRDVLGGKVYPWREDHVLERVKDPDSLDRLVRSGMLTRRPDGSWTIWHDRLLNWLVALTLVHEVKDSGKLSSELPRICAEASEGRLMAGTCSLGYVPMDTLWLLNDRGVQVEVAAGILAALEREDHAGTLYSELVPTLGSSAVPGLLARLDQRFAGGAPDGAEEVADCLAHIHDHRVTETARSWLKAEARDRQSAAIHILCRRGDPECLDRLWALHTAAEGDQQHGLVYQERMEAIAAALQQEPKWLLSQLREARTSTPALVDLVYQLARLPEGKSSWLELKAHLKQIVPENHWRCLLRCIYAFRDVDEREFVQAQTGREEDLAGAMALAALTRLDPELAVDALASSEPHHLAFTRGWHLQPLLAALPERTRAVVRCRVVDRDEPWQLSHLYNGAENELDTAGFVIVLGCLEQTLRNELASGRVDANSGPLYHLLRFIDLVVAPELVRCLEQQHGKDLPALLGQYLVAIGSRPDRNARLCDELALRLLQRIGHPSLVDWVNAGLRSARSSARVDALKEAHKHADGATCSLLREIALRSSEENARYEAYLAMEALCHLGEWETLLEVVCHLGLVVPECVVEQRRREPPLEGGAVEELLARLRGGDTTPGVLLAAGLTRDPRFLDPVSQAVLAESLGQDALLAAANALALLDVTDGVVVSVLGRFLGRPQMPERLPWVLLQIGTPAALEAVEAYLTQRFDVRLAVALARYADKAGHKDITRHLAKQVWDIRSRAMIDRGYATVLPLLGRLGEVETDAYLQSAAFGQEQNRFGDSLRAAGIRGLVQTSPERAFQAVKEGLRDPSERDRATLARLLMKNWPDHAIPVLLEVLATVDDEALEIEIADILCPADLGGALTNLLNAEEATKRRVGGVLSARRLLDSNTQSRLRSLALDTDEAVSQAAIKALREDIRARGVAALVTKVLSVKGGQRWVLLDQIARASRGTRDRAIVRPDVLHPLRGQLTAMECDELDERLDKGEEEYRRGAKDRAARKREA